MAVPSHFHILYDQEAIQKRTQEMGKEISGWLRSAREKNGSEVVAIPMLRGGIFFFADLLRACDESVFISPATVSSYVNDKQSADISIKVDEEHIKGRSVLLVDEICDSGRSLETFSAMCVALGAVEVCQAVLVKREVPGAFEPRWVGFRHNGPEWMVGFGMDEKERYRNLSSVYIIGDNR